jgi:hypothetical protein
MHVEWNWIKQRPHFLAEGLSKYFDVEVRYERGFGFNKKLTYNQKKDTAHLRIRSIKRLPFNRFHIIYLLNSLISRIFLSQYQKCRHYMGSVSHVCSLLQKTAKSNCCL